jgi:hypothetical protein
MSRSDQKVVQLPGRSARQRDRPGRVQAQEISTIERGR